MIIEFWERTCPMCGAVLQKNMPAAWKCWRCYWTTEDVSRGCVWDGMSQKPLETTNA